MKMGIQQFQLRNCFKNEKTTVDALSVAKEVGFDGIELNGFLVGKTSFVVRTLCAMAGMGIGKSGDFDWKKLTADAGLEVLAFHGDLNSILNNTDEIAAQAKSFGTHNVVITGMRSLDYGDSVAVAALCKQLDSAGKKLADRGLQLLYHNHNCEFVSGTPYWQIVDNTDSDLVKFELDVYWAADAGCNLLDLMDRLGGRLRLLHLCDRGIRPQGKRGSILKCDCIELGQGNMNIAAIVGRAYALGVEAVILECTKNFVDNDAVKSMRISGEYLKKLLN